MFRNKCNTRKYDVKCTAKKEAEVILFTSKFTKTQSIQKFFNIFLLFHNMELGQCASQRAMRAMAASHASHHASQTVIESFPF